MRRPHLARQTPTRRAYGSWMQSQVLTTARLRLAAPEASDVDAIFDACQDPEVPRWTTVPSPYLRRDAEEFVERTATWWANDDEYTWAIHHGDELAGVIGLHRITSSRFAEIGFWVSASSRGKGILTEAAEAVIDFGFSPQVDLQRIEWRAVVGNLPSAKTARRLGFRYEGTLRQALASPRGLDDGWIAGLLATDERMPQPWPFLTD